LTNYPELQAAQVVFEAQVVQLIIVEQLNTDYNYLLLLLAPVEFVAFVALLAGAVGVGVVVPEDGQAKI